MGGILRGQPSVERIAVDSWKLAGCYLKPLHFVLQSFVESISKLCLLLHSLQSQFEFLVLISQASGVSL